MTRVVVIGTGTSVGKTFVSVALARAARLRRPAAAVLGLKPIETGVGAGESDAERLAAALHVPVTLPLYAFEPALSPHLAAARARESIEISSVAAWVRAQETAMYDTTSSVASSLTIIETAGGVFSPLSQSATNFDLARALEPASWILVAPDALGVLHDLTATLAALEQRGRRPDHVVLSAARGRDASTGTNAAELSALGITTPSAVFGPDGAHGVDALIDGLLR